MSKRIFVDCEFNGFGGQLISMALVPDHDIAATWYEVLDLPEDIDPWVNANVIPHLGKAPISKEEFRASFLDFLKHFHNPTICADWYPDLVHFFSMFAGKDHTESVGFSCEAELVLIDSAQSDVPHNALSDAKAFRKAWYLERAA